MKFLFITRKIETLNKLWLLKSLFDRLSKNCKTSPAPLVVIEEIFDPIKKDFHNFFNYA